MYFSLESLLISFLELFTTQNNTTNEQPYIFTRTTQTKIQAGQQCRNDEKKD